MKMKRLIVIILILVISMLLIACSKNIEPQGNATTSEETQTNESDTPVITEPEEENETIIPVENITEPRMNETEVNVTEPEEPITLPEEEPLAPSTDECLEDLEEICAGPPKIDCIGVAEFDADKRTITFFAKNEMGGPFFLNNFVSYDEEEPWRCMTRFVVEQVDVSIDGSELVNVNTRPEVSDGSIIKFVIKYTENDKDYIDQKFTLDYTTDINYESYFLITEKR